MKSSSSERPGRSGSALVPVLARDHDVVAVSRSERAGEGTRHVGAGRRDRRPVGARRARRRRRRVLPRALARLVRLRAAATASRPRRSLARRHPQESGRSIYLGGLGDDSPDLSPHLRSRIETGLALASGSVPVTTLRAAMVVGAGSAAFETILALVDRLPAMICPRWVSTPTQPIAIDRHRRLPRGRLRPRGRTR